MAIKPSGTSPQGRRSYVDTRCGQMHVRHFATGADHGRPPVFLLHQTSSNSREYLGLANILCADRQVYAVDLPGYGASDPVAEPQSIDTLAGAVLDAAETLTGQTPIDVMGTHGGSFVAVQMSLDPRALVRRLICAGLALDVSPKPGEKPFHASDEPFLAIYTRLGGVLGRLTETAIAEGRDPEDVSLWMVDALKAYDRRWFLFGSVLAYPIAERLAAIHIPTLVLAFADDMYDLTLESAPVIPGGILKDLSALGGLPYTRAPAAVSEAVKAFLDN